MPNFLKNPKNCFSKNSASLARKIRETIVDVTQKNGGHLASNLGVVELSIALHKVFDFNEDKIVFDVSHQCYAHKILSGRSGKIFETLRQTDGISGFTNPKESTQDVFIAGHAGTALSSAIGLASARDLLKEEHHVIAFIGDASLTNGLTLEALNNIRPSSRLIVILNDNGYAISKNVGAIAKYLNEISRNGLYNRTKRFIKNITHKLPFGTKILRTLSKLKFAIKSTFLPSSLFEYYGLKYIGPIDGHNLTDLVDNLEFCKNFQQPILLHVKTRKGYGNKASEIAPEEKHGIVNSSSNEEKYSNIFGDELCKLAEKNPQLVAITAAMSHGTGLHFFQDKFPQRFFDVGIAEGHAITFAAGLSRAGLLPVCALYSTFLQRAFDNIFHDIALQNLPILIGIDRAGLCANDGPTHHGLFDISILRCLPNIVFMQPKNEAELRAMMSFSVDLKRPCCIRYPRESVAPTTLISQKENPIILGKSEIICKGNDICIFALGEKVQTAIEIAKNMPEFSFSIVNMRFIKPIDEATILEMAKTHRYLCSIEDHVISGGMGSAIAEVLSNNKVLKPFQIFAWPDDFLPHATCNVDLEKQFHFTSNDISKTIIKQLTKVF